MNFYTIKPLVKLINTSEKSKISLKDIEQIEKSLKKQIKNTAHDDKILLYLLVIEDLKAYFKISGKLSKEFFKNKINAIIKNNSLYFIGQDHSIAHQNLLEPVGKREHRYDLAFYNKLAAGYNINSHHKIYGTNYKYTQLIDSNLKEYKNDIEIFGYNKTIHQKFENAIRGHVDSALKTTSLSSVFYMRCEEFDNNIIFGNIQIDSDKTQQWKNKNIGRVLQNNSNLYKIMIQEAIKHGVNNNKKIMFQDGYAVMLSQWYNKDYFAEHELITKDNIKEYSKALKIYEEKTKQLKLGDILKINYINDFSATVIVSGINEKEVITHNTNATHLLLAVYKIAKEKEVKKEKNYFHEKNNAIKDIDEIESFSYINDIVGAKSRITEDGETKIKNPHVLCYNYLKYYFYQGDAETVLFYINQIFSHIVNVDFNKDNSQKLEYLKHLMKSHLGKNIDNAPHNKFYNDFKLYEVLEDFLYEFDYSLLVINNYKDDIKVIKDQNNRYHFVLNSEYQVAISLVNTDVKIGDFINIYEKESNILNGFIHGQDLRIARWYKYTIPEILKKLNINFKSATIQVKKFNKKECKDKVMPAPVWEITTPNNELKKRPFIVF